jgi:protein-S-isoprenylcysteine O-methyltransferase Ste14
VIAPAQIVYLVFTVLLTLIGVAVLVADIITGGRLHVTNAIVGGGALLLSVALAIPLRLKDALALVAPYLDKISFSAGDTHHGAE